MQTQTSNAAPLGEGDHVVTPIAPGRYEDVIVFNSFEFEGRTFYTLVYRAQDEPTFVVRQRGQVSEVPAAS